MTKLSQEILKWSKESQEISNGSFLIKIGKAELARKSSNAAPVPPENAAPPKIEIP